MCAARDATTRLTTHTPPQPQSSTLPRLPQSPPWCCTWHPHQPVTQLSYVCSRGRDTITHAHVATFIATMASLTSPRYSKLASRWNVLRCSLNCSYFSTSMSSRVCAAMDSRQGYPGTHTPPRSSMDFARLYLQRHCTFIDLSSVL